MARVGTTYLNLGMWTDDEDPGAGSQAVDNVGLNGDKIKIDTAVGPSHNPDGSHKADVIDGPSLKTTTVDGATLQATGTPRKLSVKDLGIQKNHIHSNVADTDSLQKNGTSGQLEIKTVKAGKLLGTGTGKAVDDSTINLNASNELQVKDLGITMAKLAAVLQQSWSYLIYCPWQEAASVVGDTIGWHPGWAETSATDVIKIRAMFRKRPIDKYLKVVARARISTGSATWKIKVDTYQLLGGGGSASGQATGNNTNYSVTVEDFSVSIDISALTDDRVHAVDIKLCVGTGAGTAEMIGVVASVHGG
jgi:hypothetical protein